MPERRERKPGAHKKNFVQKHVAPLFSAFHLNKKRDDVDREEAWDELNDGGDRVETWDEKRADPVSALYFAEFSNEKDFDEHLQRLKDTFSLSHFLKRYPLYPAVHYHALTSSALNFSSLIKKMDPDILYIIVVTQHSHWTLDSILWNRMYRADGGVDLLTEAQVRRILPLIYDKCRESEYYQESVLSLHQKSALSYDPRFSPPASPPISPRKGSPHQPESPRPTLLYPVVSAASQSKISPRPHPPATKKASPNLAMRSPEPNPVDSKPLGTLSPPSYTKPRSASFSPRSAAEITPSRSRKLPDPNKVPFNPSQDESESLTAKPSDSQPVEIPVHQSAKLLPRKSRSASFSHLLASGITLPSLRISSGNDEESSSPLQDRAESLASSSSDSQSLELPAYLNSPPPRRSAFPHRLISEITPPRSRILSDSSEEPLNLFQDEARSLTSNDSPDLQQLNMSSSQSDNSNSFMPLSPLSLPNTSILADSSDEPLISPLQALAPDSQQPDAPSLLVSPPLRLTRFFYPTVVAPNISVSAGELFDRDGEQSSSSPDAAEKSLVSPKPSTSQRLNGSSLLVSPPPTKSVSAWLHRTSVVVGSGARELCERGEEPLGLLQNATHSTMFGKNASPSSQKPALSVEHDNEAALDPAPSNEVVPVI